MKKYLVFLFLLIASVAYSQENKLAILFPDDNLRREFSIRAFAILHLKGTTNLDPSLKEVKSFIKHLKSLPYYQLDNILDNFYHSNENMREDEKGYYVGYSRASNGGYEEIKLIFISKKYFPK